MNPLDVQRDLEVHTDEHGGASVRIPLTEPGDWLEWMKRYSLLARSEDLEAEVAPEPGHAVLTVKLSRDASWEQTFELLDAAVGLIERAKARQTADERWLSLLTSTSGSGGQPKAAQLPAARPMGVAAVIARRSARTA